MKVNNKEIWWCLKVDDCLLKTTGSANEILNILLEQWIMFDQSILAQLSIPKINQWLGLKINIHLIAVGIIISLFTLCIVVVSQFIITSINYQNGGWINPIKVITHQKFNHQNTLIPIRKDSIKKGTH